MRFQYAALKKEFLFFYILFITLIDLRIHYQHNLQNNLETVLAV